MSANLRESEKMERRFYRKSIGCKKARRVSEVNTSRINKRKYYGLGVEIKEMKESLEYHFTHTSVIDQLQDSLVGTESRKNVESVADSVVNNADFLRDDPDAVLEDVEEPLSNGFEKGTRRAFDSNGDTLEPADVDEQVNQILQEQKNYISKLDADLRSKARQIIREGVQAGLATSVIVENLREELKNLIDNRTSTISNSEVIAAGAAGTMATFQQNGVNEVMWISSQDDRVCEPGNFSYHYNGTHYTSCRELDGTSFSIPGNFPTPVLESHPNCRCTLISTD